MLKSESIKELAAALSLAQKEMEGAKKDSTNPFFKSKYADLGSVIEASREPLAKNGLSVAQFPVNDGDRVGVETILMHKSGEWISDRFLVQPTKNDPQAAGSAISYTRRYARAAVIGIYQEDDDAQQATHTANRKNHSDVPQKPSNKESANTANSEFDPNPPKTKPYTGTEDQKKVLVDILAAKKVPIDKWEAIATNMVGKFSKDIDSVIRASNQ